MNNYLKNRRVYIAGPIEFADHSKDWRGPVKQNLVDRFGLRVFDPIDDPKQEVRAKLNKAKEENDFETVSAIVHNFVRIDLSIVDRMDFLIAYLPHRLPTTGTVHEIVSANDAKKPVFIVCPQGKNKVPDWYFGFINHKFMFGHWENLYDYLIEVDEGRHKTNNRWTFVYNYGDFNNLGW